MKLSIKDITQTFIALHLKYKVSSTAARINNLVFLSFWKLSINNGKTRKLFKDDVFADIDDNFNYEFIEEFFEKEYFKLDRLLSDKALSYWYDLHCENNSIDLDSIETIYKNLNSENCDYKDEEFENLVDIFDNLITFDIDSSDTEGLSSKSIECLVKYNNIIENFKNKFNEVKDELAIKVGITKE